MGKKLNNTQSPQNEKKRKTMFLVYKKISNKIKDIRKKIKIKRLKIQAERIEKLAKDYDAISWKNIKALIPKLSNFQSIIEEAINESGTVIKGPQFLEIWRE